MSTAALPERVAAADLAALLHAIVASFATIEGLREARLFPGAFDLKSQPGSPPRPGHLGRPPVHRHDDDRPGGQPQCRAAADRCRCGEPVELGIARAGRLLLAERTAALILANKWGVPGVSPATGIKIDNLTSDQSVAKSIAMYGVSWTQRARLAARTTLDLTPLAEITAIDAEGLAP